MSGKISNIFFFSIIVSRSHTAPKPQAKLRKIFGLRIVKKLMETFMRKCMTKFPRAMTAPATRRRVRYFFRLRV